ncbi:MAG: FAD-dependent oxidoreductase [Pseudomonadales bacterium]
MSEKLKRPVDLDREVVAISSNDQGTEVHCADGSLDTVVAQRFGESDDEVTTISVSPRGYWAIFAPGQISRFGNKMAPIHGNVHFCGEYTAVANRGMEGAMESAERVAMIMMLSISSSPYYLQAGKLFLKQNNQQMTSPAMLLPSNVATWFYR